MLSKEELLDILARANQQHVLDHYDSLSSDEQAALAEEIEHVESTVGFAHLNDVLRSSLALLHGLDTAAGDTIEPPPADLVLAPAALPEEERRALHRAGQQMIAEGRVALLILAGGSGTRLGVEVPKGLFTCDELHGDCSLFQLHCEKVLRAQAFSGVGGGRVQVLIMTSDQNDAETQEFFRREAFFGLEPSQVHFFRQSSLPCYSETDGRVLMSAPGRLCLAPGGNGGVWRSVATAPLVTGGGEDCPYATALELLQATGVQYTQISSVDNALARMADPLLYGYVAATDAEVGVKTVRRRGPDERVGVFARRASDGRWGVREYTELSAAQASAVVPESGELLFNCANIAYHVCSTAFFAYAAERMRHETRYHAAIKSIATMDGSVMGVKIEAFIFDMFAYAGDVAAERRGAEAAAADPCGGFRIMQVEAAEEFAPIKNSTEKSPNDNPHTAAVLVRRLHTQWAMEALCCSVECEEKHEQAQEEGEGERERRERRARALEVLCMPENAGLVQVSPLVSYAGEGLESYVDDMAEAVLRWAQEGPTASREKPLFIQKKTNADSKM